MEQNQQTLFDLQVINEAKSHLADTAKWARFLAICGMIGIVLMICVGGYFALVVMQEDPDIKRITRNGEISTSAMGAGALMVYVGIGLLYFFPCLFTLQFANKMKLALQSNDDMLLSESFRSLKKTFRYLGVLTIIFLCFFVLGMVANIFGDNNVYNR